MRIAGAPLGSRGNSTFSPRVIWQSMTHPEWALRTLMNGGARFRNMEPYANGQRGMAITKFIGSQLNGSLDWDYLAEIRQQWQGNLLLKGILHAQDAMGVDGLVISNHGGRQLMRHRTRLANCREFAQLLAAICRSSSTAVSARDSMWCGLLPVVPTL